MTVKVVFRHSRVAGMDSGQELCRRTGDTVALRFPDPEGREDTAGRVIPHDFVISGPLAARIDSVNDGHRLIWSHPDISDHPAADGRTLHEWGQAHAKLG
jgi:hypothetical protein